MCFSFCRAAPRIPKIARLSASVPPEVRTISRARAPSSLPGSLYGCLHILTEPVDGGGIAVIRGEVRLHGLEDFRSQRRGGIVVEIDASHGDSAGPSRAQSGRVLPGVGRGRPQKP